MLLTLSCVYINTLKHTFMQRTQIYLDRQTHRRLRSLAVHRGTTLSHLVREAVDNFIADGAQDDPTAIIDRASGLWADRLEAETDARALREGWAQRDARLAK